MMFENSIYYTRESARDWAGEPMAFHGPHEKSFNFLQFSPYVWKVAKGLSLQERNILFVDRYVKQKHIHLDTDS